MSNCNSIKSQIEEAALGEYGQAVSVHLLQCDACRNFEKEQRSLRELVGSLGTVQAPADFDFKLRARMANASSARTSGLKLILSPVFASAAIVLLIGVIAGITYINKRPSIDNTTQNTSKPAPVQVQPPSSNPEHNVALNPVEKPKSERSAVDSVKVRSNNAGGNQIAYRPRRQMGVADSSSTGATTVGMTNQSTASRMFPIDASLNSVKVSLDDGRGNARTISLPGVSFGSQRVVGNQLNQKGVW